MRESPHLETSPAKLWHVIQCSCDAWLDDDAPSMGAALAYYTLLSLAPLFVIVVALAGAVVGPDAAKAELVSQSHALVGEAGASVVRSLLGYGRGPATSVVASIVGAVTMVIGATSSFNELQNDLDRIWRAPIARRRRGVWSLIKSRLVSLLLVLASGSLLLTSLVLTAVLSMVGRWWQPMLGGWDSLLQVIDLVLSFVTITVVFALIYKFLPRVRVAWRDVWVGATVTAVLFTVGKSAIAAYLGRSAFASAFGAAGSIIVLIVWIYYSAQIFLLGAEFTCVYAHRYGSLSGVTGGRWPSACEPPPATPPPAKKSVRTPHRGSTRHS